jgi:hypothetical protein
MHPLRLYRSGAGCDRQVFRDHTKVCALHPDPRFQGRLPRILMRQRALPHHQLGVPLRGSRQSRVPFKRPQPMLSAVFIGRLHQLVGFV